MTGAGALKPADAEAYARDSWSPAYRQVLSTEVARYPFPVMGARVLDLGAGPGAMTAVLLRAGAAHVTWQDVDPRFAAAARDRLAGAGDVRFEVRDLLDLPYGAGEFDAVVLRSALHWARDEALVLARVAALLRPGGHLALHAPSWRRAVAAPLPAWRRVAHLVSPPVAAVLRRKPVTTLWVLRSLTLRRLRRAGLEVVAGPVRTGDHFELVARRPATSS
jgi:SAM-dependent methyltransferase